MCAIPLLSLECYFNPKIYCSTFSAFISLTTQIPISLLTGGKIYNFNWFCIISPCFSLHVLRYSIHSRVYVSTVHARGTWQENSNMHVMVACNLLNSFFIVCLQVTHWLFNVSNTIIMILRHHCIIHIILYLDTSSENRQTIGPYFMSVSNKTSWRRMKY